ncbi:MAG TPA: L,D-transpeptidase family protein [Acidimicrobiales bacterium]|nr:L,D-transpeptidase family protein [Acidimicrobiales bacterium]
MTVYGTPRRRLGLLLVPVVLVAIAAAAVIGFEVGRPGRPAGTPTGTLPAAAPSGRSGAVTTTTPAAPLVVAGTSPADGTKGVDPAAPVTVTFSAALAAGSPMPVFSPPLQGSWAVAGDVATFTPASDALPLSVVTLTVPAGAAGPHGAAGGELASGTVTHYRVRDGSLLRLQQLLALLDYAPLTWTPSGAAIAPGDSTAQAAALFNPPAGSFSWTNSGWPSELVSLWKPGRDNVFTRGLVMSFEADHSLTTSGVIGPGVWSALLGAIAANTLNTGGYNYALADKQAPESLTVWHDGKAVLHSPANTGIAGAPTPDGNFPVNTRLRSQVMRGTNPDGSHYADLVQYIAYFHGSDAVHYMDRADYGIPQSLGCVELPLSDAARAWPYLAYGTLVTVIH